jgi:hypothetical protein
MLIQQVRKRKAFGAAKGKIEKASQNWFDRTAT